MAIAALCYSMGCKKGKSKFASPGDPTMEIWEHPLILEAMTLRGLGSYLHGARLEIRPLTILCGTNGSGKSTWFRMLRILQSSLERGTLPFSFEGDVCCGEDDWHDYTNPLVRPLIGYSRFLVSAMADRDFGPPGTVGLHIKSSAELRLREIVEAVGRSDAEEDAPVALMASDSLPHSFLSDGYIPQGTEFRVRITDPTDLPAIHEESSVHDRMVELVINNKYSIRFERRHPSPTRRYTATCTRAFWPGCEAEDLTDLVVAEFDVDGDGLPINVRSPSSADSFDIQEAFCLAAIKRIRQLPAGSLRSVFWIGAIRSIQRRGHVEENAFSDSKIIGGRHVGGEGEYAQALARRFAYNKLCLAEPRGQGSINLSFSRAGIDVVEELLAASVNTTPSPARRIWESATEQSRQAIGKIERSKGKDAEFQAAQVLNDALKRRDLFDANYWPEDHETDFWRDLILEIRNGLSLESAIAFLDQNLSSLSDDEITWLNRKLIEAAFPGLLHDHPGLVFETYYSVWLKRLLDTRLVYRGEFLADDWIGEVPPCGYLLGYTPDEVQSNRYERTGTLLTGLPGGDEWMPDETSEYARDLCRLVSPPFMATHLPAAPVNMSSGFHQVASIIVQAGLMRANEILCVENPEVHLHPTLQLEIAEFFVRQAAIGKYMIIETHSDLVVRRVMRAVLEEELKQEAVRLYFTRMETKSEPHWERPVASSVLERIEIDERGRIRNWPDGFLDADIRESRRLLDVMYGTPVDDVEEEEEEPF
ncbi:MAG: DUF3696 domain-containing protein [Isosphaerales bacterium]